MGRVSKLEIAIEVAASLDRERLPGADGAADLQGFAFNVLLSPQASRTPKAERKRGAQCRAIAGSSKAKTVSDSGSRGSFVRILQGPDAAYGYRKITVLCAEGISLVINKKKVYRLCKEMGILGPRISQKQSVPRRVANNRKSHRSEPIVADGHQVRLCCRTTPAILSGQHH